MLTADRGAERGPSRADRAIQRTADPARPNTALHGRPRHLAGIVALLRQTYKISEDVLEAVDRHAAATGRTRQEVFSAVASEAFRQGEQVVGELASAASYVADCASAAADQASCIADSASDFVDSGFAAYDGLSPGKQLLRSLLRSGAKE